MTMPASTPPSIVPDLSVALQCLAFALVWELLYRISHLAVRAATRQFAVEKHLLPALHHQGPSYCVSLVNAVICIVRGLRGFRGVVRSDPALQFCGLRAVVAGTADAAAAGYTFNTSKIFFGYMLYDLVHVIVEYPHFGGMDMLLHHLVFIVGVYLGVASKTMVLPFTWLIFTELSTVFLNLRWFLIKAGKGDGPAITVVAILFALTFGFARVLVYGLGTVHFALHLPTLRTCQVSYTPEATLAIIMAGQVMNAVWFYKIVKIAMRGGKKPTSPAPQEPQSIEPAASRHEKIQ